MERTFRRSFESLDPIFGFIDGFFVSHPAGSEAQYAVKLAVEELFTNMVKYTRGSTGDILVDIQGFDDRIAVSLTDFDADRFDIREVAEVRVDRPIEERRPGGLGIHLIKKIMDRIEYEYVGRRSKTTLIKMLG